MRVVGILPQLPHDPSSLLQAETRDPGARDSQRRPRYFGRTNASRRNLVGKDTMSPMQRVSIAFGSIHVPIAPFACSDNEKNIFTNSVRKDPCDVMLMTLEDKIYHFKYILRQQRSARDLDRVWQSMSTAP